MNLESFLALSRSPLFKGMKEQDIEYLSSFFTLSQVREGRTVFVENMPGESLYLIGQGTVQISLMMAEADEQNLVSLDAGDVFGEMAIIDHGNRSATARITRNAILYGLNQKSFNVLAKENSQVALHLTLNIARIFSARIRSVKKDYQTMLGKILERQK